MERNNFPLSTLAGRVLDSLGTPITAASVQIGPCSALTDTSGFYSITNVPIGTHTLVCSKAGYQVLTNVVTIPGCIQNDLVLTPSGQDTAPRLEILSGATNGQIVLSWVAAQGKTYQLQYKTNLSQPSWIDISIPMTGNSTVLSATNDAGPDPQRFYSLRQQ